MAKKNPWEVDYQAPRAKAAPSAPGGWKTQIDGIIGELSTRKPHQFDLNGDAVFQSLKDQAIVGGRTAMADTMAKATGGTGGQNNSFAQAVGQQAYNSYLQGLNGHIPALARAAEDRYDREGQRLRDNLNLYLGMEDRDRAEQNRAYDRLYDIIGGHGYNPTDDELAAAGMNRGQADALLNSFEYSRRPVYRGGAGAADPVEEEEAASVPQLDNAGGIESDVLRAVRSGAGRNDVLQYLADAVNEGIITSGEASRIFSNVFTESKVPNGPKYEFN